MQGHGLIFLLSPFFVGLLMCIICVILFSTIINYISSELKTNTTNDISLHSLQNESNHIQKLDDVCFYQRVFGNQTEYYKFKNATSIILKMENVHEDLRIVVGISLHHKKFPNPSGVAQIEILHGREGLVMKGTSINNDLFNGETQWNTKHLNVFPNIGDRFILNFNVIDDKLQILFYTKNSLTVLTLKEEFTLNEDLRIKFGTYENDVPYLLCFIN